jgi:hypothetical protein
MDKKAVFGVKVMGKTNKFKTEISPTTPDSRKWSI